MVPPSNNLWVGNLANDVTDADLTSLFEKYGPLDSVTIYSSRRFGFLYFKNINDSMEAKNALQGSFFHGFPLRIEFAKPEKGPEFREMRGRQYPSKSVSRPDTRHMPQDFMMNYSNSMCVGFTRQHPFLLPSGQRVDGNPSKFLCISYPPSIHVEKHMLHNAMILFGEIDEIKIFYDRNFSLVQFRSVEEAQCAKEGLQGKLFNDPRIRIEYSSCGSTLDRDILEYHPSITGPTTDFYPNEDLSQASQMGMVGHNHYYENNYIWRGIFAKAGISEFHARCYPVGEWIKSKIPDVVNCFARTELDTLTTYCTNAIGFNIVYFSPDREEDFDSYTGFLRYLTSKEHAMVANFDDGTNLFLVPPSDFLMKVLNKPCLNCVYGVVVKIASHMDSGISLPQEFNQPQYVDAPQVTSSQVEYNVMPFVERVSSINYNQVTREDLKLPSRKYNSLTDAFPKNSVQESNTIASPINSVHQSNTVLLSQAGVYLTTELIETLTKMLPANKVSSVEETIVPAGDFCSMPLSDIVGIHDKFRQQSWRLEQQAPSQAVDHVVQFGNQFNNQRQVVSQLQAHPQVLNMPNHYFQGSSSFSQMQEHKLNLQAQGGPLQAMTSTINSQGTQHSAQSHIDRQLQFKRYQDIVSGFGIDHDTDVLRHYNSFVPQ